jgi:toxin ParE1/3/4
MTVEVLWSPRAREDLVEIYMTIGIERPDAAERYFDRIEEKVQRLQDQPRRGPRRSDIRPGARMLVEAPYFILYETIPDTDEGPLESVVIVRVVDGRRDLPSLF